MGYNKDKRPTIEKESIGLTTSTGATMGTHNATFVYTTKTTSFYYLPDITHIGQVKWVGWRFDDTGTMVIRAFSTAHTFTGSTGNVLTVNTSGYGAAMFIARTTASWAPFVGAGGLTVSGATY
jgi:hypothetical protein